MNDEAETASPELWKSAHCPARFAGGENRRSFGERVLTSVQLPRRMGMGRLQRTAFLVLAVVCLVLAVNWTRGANGQAARVTVFEGPRLITGDGSAPIEDSAFVGPSK